MKTTTYSKKIPTGSIIKDSDFQQTSYVDAISTEISTKPDYSTDYLTTLFFRSLPNWVLKLLKFRNFIVKPFGIKTNGSFKPEDISLTKKYVAGDTAVYFKVLKRNENEIVMAENDKHLNFRTSVLKLEALETKKTTIYCITIVKFNNLLGKLYFLTIKPFHKLIIKTLLKNLNKNLNKNEI